MAAAAINPVPLNTTQIMTGIKHEFLRPLVEIMGRKAGAVGVHGQLPGGRAGGADAQNYDVADVAVVAASAGAAGGAAGAGGTGGIFSTVKHKWNSAQFIELATFAYQPNAVNPGVVGGAGQGVAEGSLSAAVLPQAPAAGAAVAGAAAVGRAVPGTAMDWGKYTQEAYDLVWAARANQKNCARIALLNDLNLPAGSNAETLFTQIFDADHVLDTKTNKLTYNIPKSDEILRRLVSALFAKKMALDVEANKAGGPGGDLLITEVGAAILAQATSDMYKTMPKPESDIFIASLQLTPQEKESLENYDKHVDELRDAFSQGPSTQPSAIQPGDIIRAPRLNSISVFTRYPDGLQEILRQRRKSDPSNPLGTVKPFERIRISMNGGANNMTGGSASRARPLYPKLVMHGGAHPFAVMEGGAIALGARTPPNPVAVLDARIRELGAQFKSATGKDLSNAVGNPINGYANTVNDTVVNLRKDLELLSKANGALSQYPVGLGIDANAFTNADLQKISDQADNINKQAAKASKQLDKLTQIKDTLEELVSKVNPAART